VGGYRVDFAATHPDDADRMLLAIEADGTSYRQSGSVRDRDRLRGEHLQRLGWRFHRIWSTNWFRDPQAEVTKLQKAYLDAVQEAQLAEPAPEPAADHADPVAEAVAEPVAARAADADVVPVVEPVAAPAAGPAASAPLAAHTAAPTPPCEPDPGRLSDSITTSTRPSIAAGSSSSAARALPAGTDESTAV